VAKKKRGGGAKRNRTLPLDDITGRPEEAKKKLDHQDRQGIKFSRKEGGGPETVHEEKGGGGKIKRGPTQLITKV